MSAGLMAMSIILDLQMQVLRQLEGIFKEMDETNGQLGIGKRPWTLCRPSHTSLQTWSDYINRSWNNGMHGRWKKPLLKAHHDFRRLEKKNRALLVLSCLCPSQGAAP